MLLVKWAGGVGCDHPAGQLGLLLKERTMPTYKLTLWGTQVLRDEDTYYVLADTKERAAALLSKLHDHACETGKPVESSSVTCLYHPDDEQHQVWQLDPNDIIDAREGIMDEDGNAVEPDETNDFGPVTFRERDK